MHISSQPQVQRLHIGSLTLAMGRIYTTETGRCCRSWLCPSPPPSWVLNIHQRAPGHSLSWVSCCDVATRHLYARALRLTFSSPGLARAGSFWSFDLNSQAPSRSATPDTLFYCFVACIPPRKCVIGLFWGGDYCPCLSPTLSLPPTHRILLCSFHSLLF